MSAMNLRYGKDLVQIDIKDAKLTFACTKSMQGNMVFSYLDCMRNM